MTQRRTRLTAMAAVLVLVVSVLAMAGLKVASASKLQLTVAGQVGSSLNSRCTSSTVTARPSALSGTVSSVSLSALDTANCAGLPMKVEVLYADYTTRSTSAAGLKVATAAQTVPLTGAAPSGTGPTSYVEAISVVIGGFSVPVAITPNGRIESLGTAGFCLNATNGSAGSGTVNVMRPCTDSAAQRWTWAGAQLTVMGKCLTLDAPDSLNLYNDRVPTSLADCSASNASQRWYRTPTNQYVAAAARPASATYDLHRCLDYSGGAAKTYQCPTGYQSTWWTLPGGVADAPCTTTPVVAYWPKTGATTTVNFEGLTRTDRSGKCAGKTIEVRLFDKDQYLLAASTAGQTVSAVPDANAVGPIAVAMDKSYDPALVTHAMVVIDGWLMSDFATNTAATGWFWPSSQATPSGVVQGLAVGGTTTCLTYVASSGSDGSQNGSRVQSTRCDGSTTQNWTFSRSGTSTGKLLAGGQCLDVESAAQGAFAQMATCTGSTTQNWVHTANGSYQLAGQDLCLDLRSEDNATVQVWGCTGNANQRWSWPTTADAQTTRCVMGGALTVYRADDPANKTLYVDGITAAQRSACANRNLSVYTKAGGTSTLVASGTVAASDGAAGAGRELVTFAGAGDTSQITGSGLTVAVDGRSVPATWLVAGRVKTTGTDNMCISHPKAGQADKVQVWTCADTPAANQQLWIYTSTNQLRHVATGSCLTWVNDPSGGPTAILLNACGASKQTWNWDSSSGSGGLSPWTSTGARNACLDSDASRPGAVRMNGDDVNFQQCSSGSWHQWWSKPA
ncbi:MAG: ricin-type beta-trefoil lectin domain protein [Brevundimonas sp.]